MRAAREIRKPIARERDTAIKEARRQGSRGEKEAWIPTADIICLEASLEARRSPKQDSSAAAIPMQRDWRQM